MPHEAQTKEAPRKPPGKLLEIFNLGRIDGVYVEHIQTGTDTADTRVTLSNLRQGGNVVGWVYEITPYITLRFSWATLAELKPEYVKQVEDWIAFEKKNARDLAEYRRLKAKFGDV